MTGRSGRSGSDTRKRGPVIGFRATPEERARIQAAADLAGLTLSSYIREQALEKPKMRAVRRAPLQTVQLAQLLGLIGLAGGELRRIGHALHDSKTVFEAEINTAIGEFREATKSIMRLMGKRTHDH